MDIKMTYADTVSIANRIEALEKSTVKITDDESLTNLLKNYFIFKPYRDTFNIKMKTSTQEEIYEFLNKEVEIKDVNVIKRSFVKAGSAQDISFIAALDKIMVE